jgi:DNA-binding MarR family transcriptional regulator
MTTPQGCTNLKLKQASRRVARLYDAHFAAGPLQKTQYSLLSHVVKLAPLTAGELARHMQLDASTLSRNLQPLLQHGWVTLAPGTDSRQRIVEATAEGRRVRAQGQRLWKSAQLDLNARLGDQAVVALHAALDQLLAVLGDVASKAASEADTDRPSAADGADQPPKPSSTSRPSRAKIPAAIR